MIQEDISPEGHHTREMYARYGAAMYFAQVMESGIKQALVIAQVADGQLATIADFESARDSHFKAVLGRLIERLKPFIKDDSSLGERLQLALAVRNELAHHFFWDHAADAVSEQGRDRMMHECDTAVELFSEIEEDLMLAVTQFAQAAGISNHLTEERVENARQQLVGSRVARRCRRCGASTIETSTRGWKSLRCSTCGAVSLSESPSR